MRMKRTDLQRWSRRPARGRGHAQPLAALQLVVFPKLRRATLRMRSTEAVPRDGRRAIRCRAGMSSASYGEQCKAATHMIHAPIESQPRRDPARYRCSASSAVRLRMSTDMAAVGGRRRGEKAKATGPREEAKQMCAGGPRRRRRPSGTIGGQSRIKPSNLLGPDVVAVPSHRTSSFGQARIGHRRRSLLLRPLVAPHSPNRLSLPPPDHRAPPWTSQACEHGTEPRRRRRRRGRIGSL
jgi:hypothetical protein